MDPMTNPAARPGSQDVSHSSHKARGGALGGALAGALGAFAGDYLPPEAIGPLVELIEVLLFAALGALGGGAGAYIAPRNAPKTLFLVVLAPALLLAACAQPGDPPAARWAATCDALDSAVRTATPLTVRMSATQADAFALGVGLFRGECVEGDPMAADHATLRRAADALARAYPLEEALSDGR